MFTKIAGAFGQAASHIAEAGGTVVGIRTGTEEPPFTVQRRVGDVEVRRYGSRIAAETSVEADEQSARSEGFRRLAGYIFGGNTSTAKIAMTAPVAQRQGEKIAMTAPVATQPGQAGDWVIRFFMPAAHNLDTLPAPNDDRVRLIEVPAESVAVLRFSGVASPEAIAAKTAELLDALCDAGIATTGDPVTWFYDPPWTLPFRRRNEVVVGVTI